MKLTKEELIKRSMELTGKINHMVSKPKRFQQFKHSEEKANLKGERAGIEWVLKYYELGYYETERLEATHLQPAD